MIVEVKGQLLDLWESRMIGSQERDFGSHTGFWGKVGVLQQDLSALLLLVNVELSSTHVALGRSRILVNFKLMNFKLMDFKDLCRTAVLLHTWQH